MPSTNINHVVLTGRLTSDPDLRPLPSGKKVCHLRVAVNARRRNPSGEWSEKPNFFDVIVFGAPGENVAKYMQKGRPIAVDGRLDWRSWETQDGRKAQAVRIIANNVQFLGSSPNNGKGALEDAEAALESIAGSEEESLNTEDQEALAMATTAA
jgi:single-strand DNA-binding protein